MTLFQRLRLRAAIADLHTATRRQTENDFDWLRHGRPLSTIALQAALHHRCVGESMILSGATNDPLLQQAVADGYADWIDGQCVLRGDIQPGERRVVRYQMGAHEEIYGR